MGETDKHSAGDILLLTNLLIVYLLFSDEVLMQVCDGNVPFLSGLIGIEEELIAREGVEFA